MTLAVYAGASWIFSRLHLGLLHPLLVSTAVMIGLLKLSGVSYATYAESTDMISFMLGPAVVSLGYVLYEQIDHVNGWELDSVLDRAMDALRCPDPDQSVKVLSGGERNRLHLAMALKEEGNVLLLDEPTNDIDVNTLRALEEGLEEFAGCAVVVSHDRWFLDRICTHILSFDGEGIVEFYQGSYSDYEEWKRERNGGKELPRRRYRKLME